MRECDRSLTLKYLCNQKWLRFWHGVMIEALVFVTFLYRRAMNRLFTSTQTFWMFNGEDMMSVAVAADFGFAIVMTKLRYLNILTLLSCDYSCQSNLFLLLTSVGTCWNCLLHQVGTQHSQFSLASKVVAAVWFEVVCWTCFSWLKSKISRLFSCRMMERRQLYMQIECPFCRRLCHWGRYAGDLRLNLVFSRHMKLLP